MYQTTFLKLLLGETLVNIARGCFVLALGMFLYLDTDSIWAFASAFVADFFIAIILQGWAGQQIDKYGPKKVLIGISFLCCIVLFSFAFAVHYNGQIALLLALALLHNAARPFIRAAIFSIVPLAVEQIHIQKLNATLAVALQIGQVLGVLMAGIAIELFGYAITFGLVSLAYFLAFISYLTLNTAPVFSPPDRAKQPLIRTLLTLVKTQPIFIRCAFIGAVDFALVGMLNLLIAPTVKHHFEGQARWLTIIELGFAFGSIIAGVLSSKIKTPETINWLFTFAACLCSATVFGLMGFIMIPPLMVISVFLMGFFVTWSSVNWVTRLQQLSPKDFLGRLGAIRLVINSSFLSIMAAIVSHFTDSGFFLGANVACYLTLALGLLTWKINYSVNSFNKIKNRS